MITGKKFDGVAGGTKKTQWDKAPWQFFYHIAEYITNKDKKEFKKAVQALWDYKKNGNPIPANNYKVKRSVLPTQEELSYYHKELEDSGVMIGLYKILTLGGRKYAPGNWKLVRPFKQRYFAALIRHLFQWWILEKYDSESAENHLHHAHCNLYFLIWGELNQEKIEE